MKFKKFTAIILATFFTVGSINVGFAEERAVTTTNTNSVDIVLSSSAVEAYTENDTETTTEDLSETETVASGSCGNEAVWSLNSNGSLTISGSGAMSKYSSSAKVPWYSYIDTIKAVFVNEGITTVSAYAFNECTVLTDVNLPEGITTIGNYAFYNCTSLTSITIPESVTSIGTKAFYGCVNITEFNISENSNISCNVKFSTGSGSSVDSITAKIGSTIELPTTERSGYNFKGWYTDSSYETEFTEKSLVLYDMTLYAKWVKVVTVTFDVNGGSEVNPVDVEVGSTIELPAPTKSDCTFGGWYSDSLWSEEFTEETEVDYNTTIYAKWIKTLPTQDEIKAKYNALNLSDISNIYSETPNITAPYSAGKLNDEFVENGIDYMNFIRYICGLQEVSIDSELEDYAQYAAAIQAIIGGLSHSPTKPSDMDSEFYSIAYEGSSSCNLAMGYGGHLKNSIQAWLGDEDSSNISVVGHRRWVINPYMLKTAFGYVYGFSSLYAFDKSNDDVDFYDFIAYPAKGNFPNNIIDNTIPWSVSLNTSLYKVESPNDINIKVTKKSNGQTWNISQSDYKSNPTLGCKYFNYDDAGYGIKSCIIFSIGSSNISTSDLDGDFDINITGLKDCNGNDTSIDYTVTFFSLSSSSSNGSGSGSGSGSSGSGSSGSSSSGSSSGGGGGGGGSVTKYTIYFEANNGEEATSKSVLRNGKVSKPTDPVYEGYSFKGWYTDEECKTLYNFSSKVTSSFTLYAGWEKDTEETVVEVEKIVNENSVENNIKVTIGSSIVSIGDSKFTMDAAPYIQPESSSTLVPLRFVAVAISGGRVESADTSSIISWDSNTKTATITADNNVIKFTAGSGYMTVNGKQTLMDNGVMAEIKDGRMYVPFRALGKALNVNVEWDADTKTAAYILQ